MKPVRFLLSAMQDIRQAKDFYHRISPELAQRFQIAVEGAISSVASQPLAMQAVENEIRRWPLETFPHGILYRDEIEFVLILAVFHPKQAPEKWRDLARN